MVQKKRIKSLSVFLVTLLLFAFIVLPEGTIDAQTTIERIAGSNRYHTAALISTNGWDTAETVVLARGDDYADALTGVPLAYYLDAPILLTPPNSLHSITREQIEALNASKVVILGGHGAVSQSVEEELLDMGLEVQRLSGDNRYDTAKKIAEELPASSTAIIAFGLDFPDALAVAPHAARNGYPILLTRTNSIPASTVEALQNYDNTIVVGGVGVVNESVFDQLPNPIRIAGAHRFATAAEIIREFDLNDSLSDKIYVATGLEFADALAGSVLAAKNNSSILLVRPTSLPNDSKEVIQEKKMNSFVILGGIGAVSSTVETALFAAAEEGETLEVHFIDVGQGDAIFIRTPEGKTILIDAGVRSAGQIVVDYLAAAGITSIDIVVGTHPHADHIGGLITVLEELPVGKVIDSGKVHTTVTYEDYLDIIDEKNIPFELGRAGDTINIDPSVSIKIVHPGANIDSYSINNASVVIKMVYNQVGFLFTGDAEEEAELEILARSYDLSKVNILKVGHHGSRTSTTHAFFDAISPDAAVICVGEGNSYGHPHEETLTKLTDLEVDIFRTDIHGHIVVTTNGITYEFDTDPYEHDPPPTRVNINTASLEDLQLITHIGLERAQEIIDLRPFCCLDDLTRVSGIGPSRLQDIKDQGIAYVE